MPRLLYLDEYQYEARKTAIYPQAIPKDAPGGLFYTVMKLNGEAGELAEEAGKMLRDDDGQLSEDRRQRMIKELGDVLWYVANIAQELNVTLDSVAQHNLEKLADRKARGKIKGEGSDR